MFELPMLYYSKCLLFKRLISESTYEGTYLSTIILNCAYFKLNVHSEEASSVINVTCMIIKCIIFLQKNYFCNGLSVLDLIYNQMLILEDSHLSFILDKPLRFTSIRYIFKKILCFWIPITNSFFEVSAACSKKSSI